MDKLIPVVQATPVTPKSPESISQWYTSESTAGVFTPSEAAWMHARGWKTTAIVTEGGQSTYHFSRRILKPEDVLDDLTASYTTAYNEGRTLNDQRYDDLVTLYTTVLDRSEDSYNTLETDDATYEALIEALITALGSDYTTYAADVDGDLDTFGTALLAEINARFDAELAKALSALTDRGMASSTIWVTESAGIERERTRSLSDANDKISLRQTDLKHKVYASQQSMRDRVVAARERLRAFLHGSRDKQVAIRNAAAEALARLIERRTDSYPDLSEIGKLAAALGAGSAEAYSA